MSLSAIARKIGLLEKQMAEAVAAEDFERAGRLRDEIAELRGESAAAPNVRQPPPGQMGLGTHIPVAAPPKNWVKPKKPDLMTRNVKGRKR